MSLLILTRTDNQTTVRRCRSPVVQQAGGAVDHVGEGRLDETPARDGLDGVGQTRRQAEQNVLHQDLLQTLRQSEAVSQDPSPKAGL